MLEKVSIIFPNRSSISVASWEIATALPVVDLDPRVDLDRLLDVVDLASPPLSVTLNVTIGFVVEDASD